MNFDYGAYGVSFRLAAESAELLGKMKQCMPWGARLVSLDLSTAFATAEFAFAGSGDQFQLTCNGIAVGGAGTLEQALEQLKANLMLHVAEHAPDLVFIHAGVVEWQGRALLFPGRSLAGKSTLIAALVRAGATYYSDDYALLDETGRVHPYACDLQMREMPEMQQRPLPASDLKGKIGTHAVPVSHVIFTEYAPGGSWWSDPMSPGAAALAMMEHAIAVQRDPARVMSALAKVMEQSKALRSARGDAAATAQILLNSITAEVGP